MQCRQAHVENINFYQRNLQSKQYEALITFISKDAIKYYDILQTTNSPFSHSVLFSSLQEQGQARNNLVSLDKLVMSSCGMIIAPDIYILQLDVTGDLVTFAFH